MPLTAGADLEGGVADRHRPNLGRHAAAFGFGGRRKCRAFASETTGHVETLAGIIVIPGILNSVVIGTRVDKAASPLRSTGPASGIRRLQGPIQHRPGTAEIGGDLGYKLPLFERTPGPRVHFGGRIELGRLARSACGRRRQGEQPGGGPSGCRSLCRPHGDEGSAQSTRLSCQIAELFKAGDVLLSGPHHQHILRAHGLDGVERRGFPPVGGRRRPEKLRAQHASESESEWTVCCDIKNGFCNTDPPSDDRCQSMSASVIEATYRLTASMPMALRPSQAAASSVVPDPAKGSMSQSPANEKSWIATTGDTTCDV